MAARRASEPRRAFDPEVGFVPHLELIASRVRRADVYPFTIPAIASLRKRLLLHPRATFFVGENGSGKSTLVEALATALGFNPEGGTKNFRFSTRPSESDLHACIRVARTERR